MSYSDSEGFGFVSSISKSTVALFQFHVYPMKALFKQGKGKATNPIFQTRRMNLIRKSEGYKERGL